MKLSFLLFSAVIVMALPIRVCPQNALGVDAGAKLELLQNYPNPYNPSTTIMFSIPAAGNLNVGVYDITGRLIEELANGYYEAGSYSVIFDAQKRSSGMYFVRMIYQSAVNPERSGVHTMKMAVIK